MAFMYIGDSTYYLMTYQESAVWYHAMIVMNQPAMLMKY